MASRTLPGIGLKADWNLGEDGWKDEMDANLRVLSVVAGQQVDQIVAVEPGAPAEGDIVILDETHATRPNEIAVYDEAAWRYIIPLEGMEMFNIDDDERYRLVAGVWVSLAGIGGTVPVGGVTGDVLTKQSGVDHDADWAPPVAGNTVVASDADNYTVQAADVTKYIRLTGAAAKTITVQDEADQALPANGEWHFRNVGAGNATFIEDTAVTINPPIDGTLVIAQGGTVTLKRVAADEFDLIGVTVPA
jgi:hypothetical protein